jgi:O-antigen/teichoic acid export membrane protein
MSVASTASGRVGAGPKPPGTRSLTGDTGLLAIGLILSQGMTTLSLSVVARLVPKADVGVYQQLFLLYGIVFPLLSGIPPALLYFLPRARDRCEIEDWILRAYAVLATTGTLAGVATVLLRNNIAALMGDPQLAHALVLYAPCILFSFLSAAAPSILIPTGHARAASALTATVGACTLIGVGVAAVIRPDADALAVGLSCGSAVSATACLIVVHRVLGLTPRWRSSAFSSWRPLLGYSLPLAASAIAGRIGYQFDRIVVGANFSPADFAVYALGAVELPFSLLLQSAVSTVLAPQLTIMWRDSNVTGMVGLWRTAFKKTTLIAAPMFCFAMLYAHDIIRVLFGPNFSQSVVLFQIYLSLIPLRIAVWGLIPQAIGNTRVNIGAAVILLLGNAAIALALVGPLGLRGPAFAAPVSTVLAAGYYLVRIRQITGISARSLIPARHALSCFAIAGAVAVATSPIKVLDLPALANLVIGLALFTPFYVLATRRLGLVSDVDWTRLRSLASAAVAGGVSLVGRGPATG